MNKNKLLTILTITYLGMTNCLAQQQSTASGGDLVGADGSISYSIGQVFYTTSSGSDITIAQGVQQPYEISEVLSSSDFFSVNSLFIYPNPSTDLLILNMRNYDKIQLEYQIIDLNGKIVNRNSISSNETKINVDFLAASIYFLKILKGNQLVKTFKIIKN